MREERWALVAALGFLVLWVAYGRLSPGTFNDDDVVHFFMARQSLHDPSLWISLWGRPLFTFLYAVPAAIGYGAVEFVTAVVSALTLWMTWKLAAAAGVRSRLAALFFTAWQPFFFKLGYSALVEPLGALCLVTGLWARLTSRLRLAALMVGLLPLTRFELIFVAGFILIPLLRQRARTAILIAAAPLVLWNSAGWFFEGNPLWLPAELLAGRFTRSLVGQPFSHYFRALPMIVGGAILPFFLLGLLPAIRRTDQRGKNLLRAVFTIHLLVLALLAWEIHDIGGSVGYLRHFVSLAPVIGVLAAAGADRWRAGSPADVDGRTQKLLLLAGLGLSLLIPMLGVHRAVWEHPVIFERGAVLLGYPLWRHASRALVASWFWPVTSLAALLVVFLSSKGSRSWLKGVLAVAAAATLLTETPIGLDGERRAMGDAADWVRVHARGRPVAVNHPWFFFLGGYDRYDRVRFPSLTHHTLTTLRPGAIVIWEDHYSPRLSGDVELEYFAAHPERFVPRSKGFVSETFKYVIFEVAPGGGEP